MSPYSPATPFRPRALTRLGQAIVLAMTAALVGCQSAAQVDSGPAPAPATATLKRAKPKPIFQVEHDKRQPQDLWARMRDGFQLQEGIDVNPRVEQQRLWFVSNPDFLLTSADRGSLYLHYIVERLEERNMPLELALLPVIESAYNPMALSRANAVGLWQFIPSTGRYFNLRQTNLYDGRQDVTASTNAALDYLGKLHDMFNGDWLLALAAYNAGEGTVSRAIERNERLGLPTDYWNLPLPQETRDYVPKLLALSEVVSSPEAYGVALEPIANQPYFKIVEINQRLDLARVAALADIDEDELYQLNPAFKKRITLDRPQHLLVPTAKAKLLADSLSSMKPEELLSLRPRQVVFEQVASAAPSPRRSYKVRRGDNLGTIARANKVSVSDLQRWNKLTGKHLKPGQLLVLQGGAGGNSATSGDASRRSTRYTVRKGDSYYLVAKRFKVQPQHLKRWNPRLGKALRPGQTLTVYVDR